MPDEDTTVRAPSVAVQVSLARIEETLKFLQRDLSDIRVHGTETSQQMAVRVAGLERWRDQADGALKILARAQSILYVVFIVGFVLGVFDAFKALSH